MEVKVDEEMSRFLTAVYASPREIERRACWEDLEAISHSMSSCWLVLEDFNAIASMDEQK